MIFVSCSSFLTDVGLPKKDLYTNGMYFSLILLLLSFFHEIFAYYDEIQQNTHKMDRCAMAIQCLFGF